MLSWLKRKPAVAAESWIRAQQPPGVPFPFPKGTKLRPQEDVVLALPRTLINDDEKIGSVLLCDDDAEFTLDDKVGAFYVRLKAGMVFALAKSCEVMLVADDKRPRSFQIMKPPGGNTQPGASPGSGPAGLNKCAYCGRQNPDAAVRCEGCGTPFEPGRTPPPPCREPTAAERKQAWVAVAIAALCALVGGLLAWRTSEPLRALGFLIVAFGLGRRVAALLQLRNRNSNTHHAAHEAPSDLRP